MVSDRLLTVEDADAWRRVLPASASVFGSVEYLTITQASTGYSARLFVVESEDSLVAYPFFLRPVNSLPFVGQSPDLLWDAVTPPFTGPLVRKASPSAQQVNFSEKYSRYCNEQRIVTEFAHLHPWNWQAELLEPTCVESNRDIVYLDLTWPEGQLWQESFSYSCRKNINRARREGVRVFQAETAGDIQEFYRIYIHTMERRRAMDRYYYPLHYFMAFFKQMPHNARFVLAEYKDRIVAGTLFLYDDVDVYSYLGGADESFQQVRPTNLLTYETIRWAQEQGKKRMILGGGYKADDGIFRFKASFSPLRSTLYVYKRIHMAEEYDSLNRAWATYYPCEISANDYFPAYRSTPEKTGSGSGEL